MVWVGRVLASVTCCKLGPQLVALQRLGQGSTKFNNGCIHWYFHTYRKYASLEEVGYWGMLWRINPLFASILSICLSFSAISRWLAFLFQALLVWFGFAVDLKAVEPCDPGVKPLKPGVRMKPPFFTCFLSNLFTGKKIWGTHGDMGIVVSLCYKELQV